MALAKSHAKLTTMWLDCFLEAAYTKKLGLGKKGRSDWCSRQVHSVGHLCYFMTSFVQPTTPGNKDECPTLGKPGQVSTARKLLVPQQVLQYSYAN